MVQKKKKTTRKTPRRKKTTAKAKRKPFTAKRAMMWLATLTIWGGIASAGVLTYYAYDLPDVSEATSVDRRAGITLLATDGQVIATSGDLYGEALQINDLPEYLPQAVMATEDRRFYSHFGVDVIGLARAMVTNVMAGRVKQGGSTLTQQVAKNLFLTPERSIKRKVQELLLAFWLEQNFTKDQIFTLYLNRVYLGAGTYGVEAAARKYFSKSARNLSLYESALIAGLLKAPSRYNPIASPKQAKARTAVVLNSMVAVGYLTTAQVSQAKAQKNKVIRSAKPTKAGRYYADWIMDQVKDYVGPASRDLIVETTLDLGLQQLSEEKMRQILKKNAKKHNVYQSAMVALSPDGAVRAMIGGRNYRDSQFNRATQAKRQPGSAFKPFVFLSAVEKGMTAETIRADQPYKIGNWSPKNYTKTFRGDVTLSEAMAHSINTVAAKIGQESGFSRVVATAHRLGVSSDLKAHPSITLGTSEVTLLELTAAYGPFANGGYGVFPFGIERIKTVSGEILYERKGGGTGRIIAPNHLGELQKMMRAVMIEGTGKNIQINRAVAGKSGTSQGARDAWFVGYSADLVLGVWMGNDNEKPMKNVSGGTLPAELWGQVMNSAHSGVAPKPLAGLENKTEDALGSFFKRLFGPS